MSRPRYIWWSYVQGMVRKYPERAAALGDLHAVGMTARYDAEPGGSGPGRTTEAVAMRQLPPTEQREYDAVRRALAQLSAAQTYGPQLLELVRLVYWDRTHRLYAAARQLHISERTAQRWNMTLIYCVAAYFGIHP